MALPRNNPLNDSFDEDLDGSDFAGSIPIEMLFAMLSGMSPQARQQVEVSPQVKEIQTLCQTIDNLVDTALDHLNDSAKASDDVNQAAAINQTVGILLVIGRNLQQALKAFAEHVAHSETCPIKKESAAQADTAMRQLGEWVQKSPVLASSEDVKQIQELQGTLASKNRAYQLQQEVKQARPAASSSADIFSALFGGTPNDIPNRQSAAAAPHVHVLRFPFPAASPRPQSPRRPSPDGNLDGVGRLFASPARERVATPELTPPASPSRSPSPSSPRR